MAFDGNGNRLIMYGGVNPTPSVILSETWAYNGQWTLLAPLGGAPGRWGHQMVRNLVLNRLVTFGGRSPTISGFANDSYQWNGSVWSIIPASNPPPPRYLYGMAYDSVRDKIVMFGGRAPLVTLGDTWELTCNGPTWSWEQIQVASAPPPREEMVLAFMPALRRTVLFGGYDRDTGTIYGDTWEYDGATWHAVSPTMPAALTPRYRMAGAYDTLRRRITMYGGYDGNAVKTETFDYTGEEWRLINVGPGNLNAAEQYVAYDSQRGRFVTFGGASPLGFSNQTHEHRGTCTSFFSMFGDGCPTVVGIGTVAATGLPRVGQIYTMQFANIPPPTPAILVFLGLSNLSYLGIPLPLELSVIGLPGCHLLTSADVYYLVATTAGSATFPVQIPPSTSFLNVQIFSQALIPDPLAPNAVGGMSRGGVGVIGY